MARKYPYLSKNKRLFKYSCNSWSLTRLTKQQATLAILSNTVCKPGCGGLMNDATTPHCIFSAEDLWDWTKSDYLKDLFKGLSPKTYWYHHKLPRCPKKHD